MLGANSEIWMRLFINKASTVLQDILRNSYT